jgi:hypothetical protein
MTDYIIDSDENSDYMYHTIANIIKQCGPRAPCSDAERKASELVSEELKNYCDVVDIEGFKTYPMQHRGAIRATIYLWAISLMFFWLTPLNSLIFSSISLAIGFFYLFNVYKEFILFEEWIPKIFPLREGSSQNVIGVIKPTGEVKNRVVYSGHIDSAFRFHINHYTKEGWVYFFIGGIVSLLFIIILYLLQVIYSIFNINPIILTQIINWIIIGFPLGIIFFMLVIGRSEKVLFGGLSDMDIQTTILILFFCAYNIFVDIWLFIPTFNELTLFRSSILLFFNMAPMIFALFFFASNKATLGAIDNLSAVAVAMCVAKVLGGWQKTNNKLYPKNTEVVIGIFGSEESGMRGAEAFARKHATEYNKINTTCVNLESIHYSGIVKIASKEFTTNLSPEVYNLLVSCCKELGLKYIARPLPPVGGTDAFGLVNGGLKAASIEGMNWKDYIKFYHTDRDNLDLINKERRPCDDHGTNWSNRNVRCAMENTLKVCLKYLEKKDKE